MVKNPVNAEIYRAWRKSDPPASYTDLATRFSVTRNTVAGAVDRQRTPADGAVALGVMRRWVNRTRPLGE